MMYVEEIKEKLDALIKVELGEKAPHWVLNSTIMKHFALSLLTIISEWESYKNRPLDEKQVSMNSAQEKYYFECGRLEGLQQALNLAQENLKKNG